jgi:hypothetical protein
MSFSEKVKGWSVAPEFVVEVQRQVQSQNVK